jgi:hypothetical protein
MTTGDLAPLKEGRLARKRFAMTHARARSVWVRFWHRQFQRRQGPFSVSSLVLLTLVGLFFLKQATPALVISSLSPAGKPPVAFAPLLFAPSSQGTWPLAARSESQPTDATPTCSIWDTTYIDCLIGQISTTIANRIFDAVRPLLEWINQSPLNFIVQTPPQATYDNTVVQSFVAFGITVVDAALAIRLLLVAYQVMVGRAIGLPTLSVLEAIPRMALLVGVAHNSLLICQWLIDFNNVLCQAVGELFTISLLRLAIENILQSFSATGAVDLLLLLSLALFLAAQVLFVAWQMLVRLATVILLVSLAPFAFLSETWLRRWASAFVAAVLVQFLQVSALALGGMLAGFFAGTVLIGFTDQLFISLLVSNALFFLVMRIPAMLREATLGPAVAAGQDIITLLMSTVGRFLSTL